MMKVLDVLAQDVGVRGVFSDWAATVSFYASCKNLRQRERVRYIEPEFSGM